MIRTILVPLDGSAPGERVLPLARELARGLSARVVLVCVAGEGSQLDLSFTEEDRQAVAEQYSGVREEDHALSIDPRMVEHAQKQVRAIAEAERYLSAVAERLAGEGLAVEAAVPYGSAVEGILTEVDVHSADLVVMSRHGRSQLRQLIGGSVAQGVLARSPVPVLLAPPERE